MHRRRHPVPGLHHRRRGRCSPIPTASWCRSTSPATTRPSTARCALVADATPGARAAIDAGLGDKVYADQDKGRRAAWFDATDVLCAAPNARGPADRCAGDRRGAAPGAPTRPWRCARPARCRAYLQVLWRAAPGGYHMEYGYSCMGYEIAGAMGIKLAAPDREVICFVGDGSYMMANSELATAVMRRVPFTVVLTDNRGYGCINRLQMSTAAGPSSTTSTPRQRRGAAGDRLRRPCRLDGGACREGRRHRRARGRRSSPPAARDIPTVIVIDTTPYPAPGRGRPLVGRRRARGQRPGRGERGLHGLRGDDGEADDQLNNPPP